MPASPAPAPSAASASSASKNAAHTACVGQYLRRSSSPRNSGADASTSSTTASLTACGRARTAATDAGGDPQERQGVAGERLVLLIRSGRTSCHAPARSSFASASSAATRLTPSRVCISTSMISSSRAEPRYRRVACRSRRATGAPRCARAAGRPRTAAGGSSASARSMSSAARSHSPSANSGSTAFEARITPELRSTPCARACSRPSSASRTASCVVADQVVQVGGVDPVAQQRHAVAVGELSGALEAGEPRVDLAAARRG